MAEQYGPENRPIETADPFSAEKLARLKGIGMDDPKYAQLLQNLDNDGRWLGPEGSSPEVNQNQSMGIPEGFDASDPSGIYGETSQAPSYSGPPPLDAPGMEAADPNEGLIPQQQPRQYTPDQLAAMQIKGQQPDYGFSSEPYNQMKNSIKEQAAIQSLSLKTQADLLEKQNEQIAKIQQETEKNQLDRQKEIADATDEIDAMSKEIGSTEIDPNGFWAKKSTGEKIMAGIVMALAGYAQGAYGTPNNAMTIFQKAMDDDVSAQKANLGIKKGELGDKRTAYQQMLGKYKDEDMATAGAKMAIIEQTKNQILSTSTRSKGDEAQARASQMIGQLDLQKQKEMQAFQVAKQKAMGETGPSAEYFIKDMGVARNKFAYESLYKNKRKFEGASSIADSLVNKIDKFSVGNKVPYDKLGKEIEALTIAYRGINKDLIVGPGAITDAERALIQKAIPEGTGFSKVGRDEAITAIKTFQSVMKRQLEMEAEDAIPGYRAPYTKQKNGEWRRL